MFIGRRNLAQGPHGQVLHEQEDGQRDEGQTAYRTILSLCRTTRLGVIMHIASDRPSGCSELKELSDATDIPVCCKD
jgi:hypothetical protein